MALNAAQYQALFTNAFGGDPSEFGIEIDDSGADAVGRVGTHNIDLQVVQQRPIAWLVDGNELFSWDGVYKPTDAKRATNGQELRSRIA